MYAYIFTNLLSNKKLIYTVQDIPSSLHEELDFNNLNKITTLNMQLMPKIEQVKEHFITKYLMVTSIHHTLQPFTSNGQSGVVIEINRALLANS